MLRSNNSSSSSLAQMNVSASSSSFFSSPHSSSARPSASSASWMPSILPVQALEDTLADELKLEPEVAEEVNENSDLDAAAEDRKMPLAFNSHRHTDDIVGPLPGERSSQTWRNRDRMKTVSVALVICLNVSVDPPDVTKTNPCARQECWIDPTTLNPQRAIEAIGNNLQKQYERWQPRARYRQSLDPPLEEVRRLATGLRRNAREERVLFHYNGHGVPKPTANGEIWVFNRNYTQYIPLSLYDLQAWMGSPSIFVYDCSNAGIIVQAFEQFADQHEREYLEQINSSGVSSSDLPPPISQRNCIQLAACAANQILPMNPELPADLFTACLTTPIKMALRWFVMQNHGMLATNISLETLERIPGQSSDRRTMSGELNWIFTAVTDTIAWNTFPRDLFQKLFRQDLLVASLFRNFLLAERIMRSYDCTPMSHPSLPSTHQHSMWMAWDLAVDSSLSQLQDILKKGSTYQSSSFFEEQLTAFEVWLKYGNENRPPPEQLPIVLQVLLSQAHRLRALDLLGRFLDLGPWAVNLALSVGIYPYVLKLLLSAARELRPLLVSIWAKILAVDHSCQTELVRESSHNYFLSVLQDDCMMPSHRTLAAFILATIVHNFPEGQHKAEKENLISICLEHLDDPEPVLRQWLAIAVGRVWDKYEKARWRGVRDNAHEKLYDILQDPVPEVRAAAVFALGTFLNSCDERTEHANSLDHSISLHLLQTVIEDGSPIVRKELVVALQYVIYTFEANFVTVCRVWLEEQQQASNRASAATITANTITGLRKVSSSSSSSALDKMVSMNRATSMSMTNVTSSLSSLSLNSIYTKIWAGINQLSHDPHKEVASMADSLIIYLKVKAREKERSTRIPSILETSTSVPSSPARPSFMLGSSPPPPSMTVSTNSVASPSAAVSSNPSQDRMTASGGAGSLNASQNPSPNATQTGRDVRAPQLGTEFLPWSAKHFTKELMKHECIDCDCDHESERHWNKEWLFNRNLEVRSESEEQRQILKTCMCRLDETVANFKTNFQPRVVHFHPYNAQIAVAGPKQIWVRHLDTNTTHCSIVLKDKKYRMTQFTALTYINAHEHALLLAGTDDGSLRVYIDKDHDSDEDSEPMGPPELSGSSKVKLVTAWNAMKDLTPIAQSGPRHHVGLCMAWEQRSRHIAVGGDSKVLRIWDAHKEMKANQFQTGNDMSYVSRLNFASNNAPTLICAGFGDGSVRMYDVRQHRPLVQVYTDLKEQILDCQIQDSGGFLGNLVCGSRDGAVRVYDTKAKQAVRSLNLGQKIVNLSIHKRAFALAAWTANQYVTIHSLLANGPQLNVIKNHEGLLGHRLGPVGCLSFHPHLLELATGPTDGSVAVYRLRKTI